MRKVEELRGNRKKKEERQKNDERRTKKRQEKAKTFIFIPSSFIQFQKITTRKVLTSS
jgi:hypothetical protein